MKRLVMTLIAALTLGVAVAQNEGNCKGKCPKPMTAEQMTTQMTSKLGLDKSQAAKVKKLNSKYSALFQGPGKGKGCQPPKMNNSGNNERPQITESMKKEMQQRRSQERAYENELKTILTDNQYTSYQKMRPQHGPKGQKKDKGE